MDSKEFTYIRKKLNSRQGGGGGNVGSKTTYEIVFEDICNLSESSKSPLY
jgi:hypothetical protein